ncbi:Rossmann-like and DUF2520 domain-containing protein [Demequina zhanjiangensis]|uniref:DUF2520 domain-containing protein n=1 Tax=Demequina zhanjiangensis TaxID=3051659 RepID=A0ABT8FYK5_9MICO|nr:DUF2520 domain-containing protein [Demequina sp. SYSU T00b26]MDN4471988.1 DUF2520 domain-containing protein [Demequina sp. SYSU T00b26]
MSDPSQRPGRLAVGVVGAGRVGAVLGSLLREAGHEVVGASGSSAASVDRIDTLLPGVPRLDPDAVVSASDLVLLTVPDDSLESLVAGLATLGAWKPGQLVVHCAGRYGTGVLADAQSAGAIPLAIHPAMTFTGTSMDRARLRDAAFAVTASAPVLPIAQALVVEMGGEPVVVAEQDRAAYHAALVHGANHVVTAVTQASATLARIGVDEPGRVLGPLTHASVDGALSDAPGAVTTLTGPVVRGDSGTVAAHLAALSGSPETLAAYRAMARATADLAFSGGRLGADGYAGVIAALGLEPGDLYGPAAQGPDLEDR